jgi:hypothetical protein
VEDFVDDFGKGYPCMMIIYYTRCGYEVPGMILLQASCLYTNSLLRGVTFEVLPLSNYKLIPTMLPLLKAFLELLLWNSSQFCRRFFFVLTFSLS